MTDNNKEIYKAILWLFENSYRETTELSIGFLEDQTFNFQKGGKIRVKQLKQSSRDAMAAKQGLPVSQVPAAVVEYATPEAIAEFKASRNASQGSAPAKSSAKATATRF